MYVFVVLTNEIVVLSRLKFESAGLRRERPERYGDVHQFVRLVAVRYDSRIGISDSAHIVFLLGHLKQRHITVKLGLHTREVIKDCVLFICETVPTRLCSMYSTCAFRVDECDKRHRHVGKIRH